MSKGSCLPEKPPPDEGIDDPHLRHGDVEGPAHVAPRDIGALFGALQQDPARRIDLGKTGVGLDEPDGDALRAECLLPVYNRPP